MSDELSDAEIESLLTSMQITGRLYKPGVGEYVPENPLKFVSGLRAIRLSRMQSEENKQKHEQTVAEYRAEATAAPTAILDRSRSGRER